MGNCLISNNKISAANEKHDEAAEYKTLEAPQKTPMPPLPSKQEKKKKNKNNKAVRFNLQEDNQESSRRGIEDVGDDRDSKTGVVRIRLFVTQEELKQLLNYKKEANQSSLEELLSAVKSRGTTVVSQVDETSSNNNGCWRPSLESIPEDQ